MIILQYLYYGFGTVWVQRYAHYIIYVLHKLADYIPISQKVLKNNKKYTIIRLFCVSLPPI